MLRFVIEAHQSIGSKRDRGICLAIVVAKLDFIYSGREVPNDSAYLATQKSLFQEFPLLAPQRTACRVQPLHVSFR